MQPKAAKQSTKTHRRSRTGCFTCRLRRKKCDEGKPACRACKHLGLSCEYKRPQWWGNVEQRKRQKDTIKTLIKRTKLTEKAVHLSPAHSADSPPELSRSLPNSESLSDNRHRSVSVDSGYTLYETDLDSHAGLYQQHHHYHHQQHFVQSPYEYDTFPKQESPYSSGFPTPRRASTASFASSTLRRSSVVEQPPFLRHPSIVESISSEDPNSYFDFGQYAPLENSPPPILHQQPQPVYIPVEGGDQQLLNHFLNSVQHLIFPILDLHSTARQEVIIPALAENESFRHCCLSIAALHIKTTQHLTGADAECVDQDITRHRFKTISGLCEALARDSDHLQILEATLSMILFQCSVGSPTDSLPDIPWHQHFLAAIELVNKLDLPRYLQPLSRNTPLTPTLNMTLTAWIDILGATMLGRAPVFADTYREKHLSFSSSGLRDMMGCEDRVMYLISEIACLEALKNQGMLNDMDLCTHVSSLAHQIDMTESTGDEIQPPIIQSGNVDPRALTTQMTAAFRYAARIYLCTLVPGFDREAPQIVQLLEKLTTCLEGIPAGTEGFDRSLVWVLLIGGSVAGPRRRFRELLRDRCVKLGDDSLFGSFGRMELVLQEVWRRREAGIEVGWRDVMQSEGWEYLLI